MHECTQTSVGVGVVWRSKAVNTDEQAHAESDVAQAVDLGSLRDSAHIRLACNLLGNVCAARSTVSSQTTMNPGLILDLTGKDLRSGKVYDFSIDDTCNKISQIGEYEKPFLIIGRALHASNG